MLKKKCVELLGHLEKDNQQGSQIMSNFKHGKDISHPNFPHGLFAGYRAGCKCYACIKANRNLKKEYHAKHQGPGSEYAERQAKLKREYRQTIKGKAIYKSSNARRKQLIKQIIEPKLVAKIYQYCPKGYQVDHIMPLSKGGMHEPHNLQYLPSQINNKKHSNVNYDCKKYALAWINIIGTFRDYPEREYTQAGGSDAHPCNEDEDIVRSAWQHAAVHKRTDII